jgi:hypothetical protein
MVTLREIVGFSAVIVGAVVIASLNHHPSHGRRIERDRAAVHAAASGFTYQQIADAWTQTKLGDATALHAIRRQFPLGYRATYQEGDAIILTFAGHGGHCVDLVSRPAGHTVGTRRC